MKRIFKITLIPIVLTFLMMFFTSAIADMSAQRTQSQRIQLAYGCGNDEGEIQGNVPTNLRWGHGHRHYRENVHDYCRNHCENARHFRDCFRSCLGHVGYQQHD